MFRSNQNYKSQIHLPDTIYNLHSWKGNIQYRSGVEWLSIWEMLYCKSWTAKKHVIVFPQIISILPLQNLITGLTCEVVMWQNIIWPNHQSIRFLPIRDFGSTNPGNYSKQLVDRSQLIFHKKFNLDQFISWHSCFSFLPFILDPLLYSLLSPNIPHLDVT